MSWWSAFAIYFIIWWTTLFASLPFGVRSQIEAGRVSPGTEPGAPEQPRFGRIIMVNTLVAGLLFGLVWFFLLPLF